MYSTKDFNQDVAKLKELIAKCIELEQKQKIKYCYKPYRNLTNY